MTIDKALLLRDDVDRLYLSRKKRGRGLACIQDSIDASIQRLEDNIKKQPNNTSINRTRITRKQKWEEKQLCGYFKRQTSEISHEKTWTWLRKGNLKKESLLMAAKNNAIRTNYVKARRDKTQQNSRCRLCSERDETINHVISEFSAKLVVVGCLGFMAYQPL